MKVNINDYIPKYNASRMPNRNLEIDQIADMDETPLILNMARTKTIAKIGSNTVNIKTRVK